MDMLSNQRKLIVYFTKINRYILVINIHLNFVIIRPSLTLKPHMGFFFFFFIFLLIFLSEKKKKKKKIKDQPIAGRHVSVGFANSPKTHLTSILISAFL